MTELGLMCGDPCAADGWSREQRIRALAFARARRGGARGIDSSDIVHTLNEMIEAWPGLRNFVYAGLVANGRPARG